MRPFFSAVTRILSILFVVVLILACAGPIIGGALYLQRYGIVTEGQVVDKEESINSTARNNNWTRRLRITVSYVPHDQTYPNEAVIGVDRPTFDGLTVGSTVAVRYQPKPWMRYQPLSGVLLAEQTPWSLFSSFTYNQWLPVVLGLVTLLLFFLLFKAQSLFPRLVVATFLVLSITASIVVSVRPAALFDQGPHATVAAQVLSVERITMEPGSTRTRPEELLQAIDRVQLEFVPEGMSDQVLAVDDIDAGSIDGIAEGDQVNVTYPVANPRTAQIVGATHDHRLINWLMIPRTIGIILIGTVLFILLSWLLKRISGRLLN
jgi:hypothetical protein